MAGFRWFQRVSGWFQVVLGGFRSFLVLVSTVAIYSQPGITGSKVAIETLEQGVKYIQN